MLLKALFKFKTVSFTLFMLALLLPAKSYALGKLGHQLSCELAYQSLTPNKQNSLDQLLSAMDKGELAHLNKYNYLHPEEKITFAKACTWADAIKKQPKFKTFASWHYINVDRKTTKIDDASCSQDCITQAIPYHLEQLKSAKSQQTKLQALMFLGHWVGDIHQPMHVSFASDLGGNKTKVFSPDGKCTNLHWLWDQCLLTRQITTDSHQERYQRLYSMLSKQLQRQQQQKDNKQVVISSVYTWASESLAINQQAEFGYCQWLEGQCVASQSQVKLPDNYQATYGPVLNQRIVLAALRLAHLLEKAL